MCNRMHCKGDTFTELLKGVLLLLEMQRVEVKLTHWDV